MTRRRKDMKEPKTKKTIWKRRREVTESGMAGRHPKMIAREPIRKIAARLKMGICTATATTFSSKFFSCIWRSGWELRCLSALVLPMTRREVAMGRRCLPPPVIQVRKIRSSWYADSKLPSLPDAMTESFLIAGV